VQLQNALINLVANARDAMPDGGEVTLRTDNAVRTGVTATDQLRPGRYVTITVQDTGTGMAPAVLARVLEPFFTTKGIGEGTGLGLSTVYGFVRQSGGDLAVASEPGKGTTVTLSFPVQEPITDGQGARP
jgi:signal transduction histidine kinase